MIPAPAFFAELRNVASRIGCTALDLMQVMFAESGLSAASENKASGASGLIQLMPFNLPSVGWRGTPAEFRALTELEQLPYVERYFAPWKLYGLTNVKRVYQAVFLPGTLPLGSDDATAIAVRNGMLAAAYNANASVDVGNKGFITVGDLRAAVETRCTGQRWRECVAALKATETPSKTRGTPLQTKETFMIQPDLVRLSPNMNAAPMPAGVRIVIIHCTRSGVSMNPSEFDGTLNYMAQPGTTSSHWVIARDGRKARVVLDNRQAWHASEDNDNAWGIEIEQGVEDDGFTPEQIAALVQVCEGYRDDFGVPVYHAQDSTSGGFVGHQETAQGRRYGKSDPGHLFPWDDFMRALAPAPAPAAAIAGVGIHFTDGSDAEIWNDAIGKTPDGIGVRYSDGLVETVWPRSQP